MSGSLIYTRYKNNNHNQSDNIYVIMSNVDQASLEVQYSMMMLLIDSHMTGYNSKRKIIYLLCSKVRIIYIYTYNIYVMAH